MILILRMRERRKRSWPKAYAACPGEGRGQCEHSQEAFIAALRMGEE